MDEDFKELIRGVLIAILVFIILFSIVSVAVLLISYPLELYSCKQTSNAMNLDYKYGFWSGCLVQVDNRWIDIDNYNEVGVK